MYRIPCSSRWPWKVGKNGLRHLPSRRVSRYVFHSPKAEASLGSDSSSSRDGTVIVPAIERIVGSISSLDPMYGMSLFTSSVRIGDAEEPGLELLTVVTSTFVSNDCIKVHRKSPYTACRVCQSRGKSRSPT